MEVEWRWEGDCTFQPTPQINSQANLSLFPDRIRLSQRLELDRKNLSFYWIPVQPVHPVVLTGLTLIGTLTVSR
eukprot:7137030-Pyramimonas_sp.AAC.1